MFKQINMKMLYLLVMATVKNHAEESMQLCSTLFQSEEGRKQSIPETRPEP